MGKAQAARRQQYADIGRARISIASGLVSATSTISTHSGIPQEGEQSIDAPGVELFAGT